MAMVSAITSPSILSVVNDDVPWLWIMGRERAHPRTLFTVTLDLIPGFRMIVKTEPSGIVTESVVDTLP